MSEAEFLIEYERWFMENGYQVVERSWSELNPDCVQYQISNGRLRFATGFHLPPIIACGTHPREWAANTVGCTTT